jgi:hypothetical protein
MASDHCIAGAACPFGRFAASCGGSRLQDRMELTNARSLVPMATTDLRRASRHQVSAHSNRRCRQWLTPSRPYPPRKTGWPHHCRHGQSHPPLPQSREARAARKAVRALQQRLSGLVGEENTPPSATIAEWPGDQGQHNPRYQRHAEHGTDGHRRPAERTQIQGKVYGERTLANATHEPCCQQQPSCTDTIIRHPSILATYRHHAMGWRDAARSPELTTAGIGGNQGRPREHRRSSVALLTRKDVREVGDSPTSYLDVASAMALSVQNAG